MSGPRPFAAEEREARRIARLFPSFCDFVDDSLFHPDWGYYSTGNVRFGEGGHYYTFPLALSPVFGRMLAQYAYRFWSRAGRPHTFEICELGAGNGQLCLDVLVSVFERARHLRRWKAFADVLRYRIIERSPALISRQQQYLGPVGERVSWTKADLAREPARRTPFSEFGLVFANEVLDCLAHHKVVPSPDGKPRVVFVVPVLGRDARMKPRRLRSVVGLRPDQQVLPRTALARALKDQRQWHHLSFREVLLPLRTVRGLRPFLLRHYPEFFAPGKFSPYFACPGIESLIRNTARLYRHFDVLWVDYGDTRGFHLTTPEEKRVFAGPPRSGATVYSAPGRNDITFMVDFSIAQAAAEQAGLRVEFFGRQGELARRSGVALDRRARDLILRYRVLGWMLATVGVGPERVWRHTSLTWNQQAGLGGSLRDDVRRSVDEFLGKRRSLFKLMILRPDAR